MSLACAHSAQQRALVHLQVVKTVPQRSHWHQAHRLVAWRILQVAGHGFDLLSALLAGCLCGGWRLEASGQNQRRRQQHCWARSQHVGWRQDARAQHQNQHWDEKQLSPWQGCCFQGWHLSLRCLG